MEKNDIIALQLLNLICKDENLRYRFNQVSSQVLSHKDKGQVYKQIVILTTPYFKL